MPGRFFEIRVNPGSVTIPPGGTGKATYSVKNLIGRAVSGEFVISAPDAGKAGWASVSNGTVRQFVLDGTQEFDVTVTVPKTVPEDPPGQSSQFGVFVKDQGDPEHVFDPGPPFTIIVKGEPVEPALPEHRNKWIIPVAIGVGVLVVAAILFFTLRDEGPGPFPVVAGLQYKAAAETLSAHGYSDSIVGTEFSAGNAGGLVLRQIPGDTAAARTDTLFNERNLVRLVVAAQSVELPSVINMVDTVAFDTLQKLSLLIDKVTPHITPVAAQNARVLGQAPAAGIVPKGTRVTLDVGVFQQSSDPPPTCRRNPLFCTVISPELLKANVETMKRIKLNFPDSLHR